MATPGDSPKKKPKASTKPKKVVDLPIPTQEAEFVSKEVADVITNAISRFCDASTRADSLRKSKLRDLEHLDVIVQEYLSSYLILGYDLNGEKVTISHASNPHDKDALVEHLRSTLLNTLNQ